MSVGSWAYLRDDTAANFTADNPVLAAGEIGWESNTRKMKVGDGVTAWTSLGYAAGEAAAIVDNGDGTVTITA